MLRTMRKPKRGDLYECNTETLRYYVQYLGFYFDFSCVRIFSDPVLSEGAVLIKEVFISPKWQIVSGHWKLIAKNTNVAEEVGPFIGFELNPKGKNWYLLVGGLNVGSSEIEFAKEFGETLPPEYRGLCFRASIGIDNLEERLSTGFNDCSYDEVMKWNL